MWYTCTAFRQSWHFHDNHTFSTENPDLKDERYNTRLGIYEENCGLENVIMSWGHDEYMYRVLKGNTCYLPDEALYMIRYVCLFDALRPDQQFSVILGCLPWFNQY